jgi:hypothetical protein
MDTEEQSPAAASPQEQPTVLPTLDQLRASEQRYYARKRGEKPDEPLSDSARAYIDRMKAAEREAADTSISALMGHVGRRTHAREFMAYPYRIDEAYPLALRIYESRLRAVGRTLEWESDTEQVFYDLVRYSIGDTAGPYDVHRGIYLFGEFGAGKTIMMQAFQDFARMIEERLTAASVAFTARAFRFHACRDIALEIQRAGTTDSLRQYMTGIRLFDDLGNEDEKKIYGNEVNAMAEILMSRYHLYQSGGAVTHCTSNLAPHECAAAYGDRIGSRVFELFNHVYLDGTDKRKRG